MWVQVGAKEEPLDHADSHLVGADLRSQLGTVSYPKTVSLQQPSDFDSLFVVLLEAETYFSSNSY